MRPHGRGQRALLAVCTSGAKVGRRCASSPPLVAVGRSVVVVIVVVPLLCAHAHTLAHNNRAYITLRTLIVVVALRVRQFPVELAIELSARARPASWLLFCALSLKVQLSHER